MNTIAILDHLLYYDEDNDIDPDEMTEWTPVDPLHLVELQERGLLAFGEVFSHRGWHHVLDNFEGKLTGTMWDGPMGVGEYHWDGNPEHNDWW